MKYLVSSLLLFFALNLNAQDSGTVVVHKDPRIENLIKKQIEINELTTRDARRFVQGFRILVMSTNDRTKANNAKTKIYQEFPELKAYLDYKPPFLKLRVGDFKTREDAEEYLSDIQKFFPTGVYKFHSIVRSRHWSAPRFR